MNGPAQRAGHRVFLVWRVSSKTRQIFDLFKTTGLPGFVGSIQHVLQSVNLCSQLLVHKFTLKDGLIHV